jgi:hypothetical protein
MAICCLETALLLMLLMRTWILEEKPDSSVLVLPACVNSC